jgi:hypothetical protein
MTCSLKRYCALSDLVVALKSCAKRLVVMNRQPVCVGGGPANGHSAVGAGGSARVAGDTLNMVACSPLVSSV